MMVQVLWHRQRPPRNAWMMHAERDQHCPQLPGRRVVICTSPRTASNTLGYLMLAAGLGLPWEYFGEGRPETLAQRWGLPDIKPQSQKFTEELMRQRCVNDVFGLKLQWTGFRQYVTREIWHACFSDALVIYLDRQDREAQAISLAVAMSTGRWFQNPDAQPMDVPIEALETNLRLARKQIEEECSGWDHFFKNESISPVRLSMEAYLDAPVSFVENIADRIGASIDVDNLRMHASFTAAYQTDANLKSKLTTGNR